MVDINSIAEDKRERIINAGILAFSENNYKKTSVDEIVGYANISKGSFFTYFKNKKAFYMYLYLFCVKELERVILEKVDLNERDFFKRISDVSKIKMEIALKYPYMSGFLVNSYYEKDVEIAQFVKSFIEEYTQNTVKWFYENIDTSKFREGVTLNTAFSIMSFCSEGLGKQILTDRSNFNDIIETFNSYIDILKISFYKKEFLK